MGQSIRLGRFFGIEIRMHITFPLILVWAALQFGVLSGAGLRGAVFGVVAISILFFIVVLHELGHGLAAQRYDIEVKQIVLLPIGGVAQLARIPEKPSEEFVIAIAGPAVNFAVAILLGIVAIGVGYQINLDNFPGVALDRASLGIAGLFAYIFSANLLLAVFNLIPAFPMDGGRVLRALLATRTSYLRATLTAVGVGQIIAVAMGIWGFLRFDFFWVLIALFIYAGAGQERRMVQVKNVLSGLTVKDAYSRQSLTVSPKATIREAAQLTLNSFQADFPVCDGEQLLGILTHTGLVNALDKRGPDVLVEEVMIQGVEPITRSDPLIQVQNRMLEENIDALPVVEDDRFLGIITTRDINEIYRMISLRSDLLQDEVSNREISLRG